MAPIPKPEPLKRTRARKRREDAKRLKVFRLVVWRREAEKINSPLADVARCQSCGEFVHRWPGDMTGEVHHRIGRRTKATRYDPDNGVLLCRSCHQRAHAHQIEV